MLIYRFPLLLCRVVALTSMVLSAPQSAYLAVYERFVRGRYKAGRQSCRAISDAFPGRKVFSRFCATFKSPSGKVESLTSYVASIDPVGSL